MVLINELTVEQINAALLHLQRSKDEVVGGNKGTTIQNISISNSGGGGGNNVDYSGTIKNLATNIEKNKTAIEKNASDISKLKSDMANIEKSVEDTLQGLADNGISDLSFDPLTKQLTITTNDGDTFQTTITQDIGVLSYDSATNKLILTTGEQTQEITLPYINSSEKGSANGVATLDSSGRVPYSQLPESAMEFLGQWNASTNTPHLADRTGTNGDFYVCNVGGTVTFGTGNIQTFVPNDRVIYNGASSQWVKLPAGQVISVNGQSGEVVLTGEGINYSTASGSPTIKSKIDSVQQSAETQSDWNQTNSSAISFIKNKPTIPAAQIQSDWSQTDNTKKDYIKNKPTIPAAQVNADWNATTGVAKILNKPTIPAAQIQSDWTQTDNTKKDFIKNKPTLATVATSGSYTDLSNKPTIPAAQIQSDWTQTDSTKKDFIKNKIPIWITSGSADDNMSPVNVVEAGNTRPVTSGGVANALALPTDAVLHYSFDEVPDYPDGSADVRLLNNNTYDIQSTNYAFNPNQATFTNLNGKLRINVDMPAPNQWFSYIAYTYTQNKLVKIKFTIQSIDSGVIIAIKNGYDKVLQNYTKVGTYEISFISQSDNQFPHIYFYSTRGQSTIVIEQIYIGDGSYSTPIIDNANGQNNATNNGGIAVQGVSGKGGNFLNGKYASVSDFNLTPNFSISVWVKPDNNTGGLNGFVLYKNSQIMIRNGATWGNNLYIYLEGQNSILLDDVLVGSLLTPNVWTHLVIVRNGTNCIVFENGVQIKNLTLADNTLKQNTNALNLCSPSNTRPQSYDDLLIFNRALSDTEVQALYLNKANTPKYYTKADMIDVNPSSVETGTVISTMGSVPQGYLDCGKRMIDKFVQNNNFPASYTIEALLQTADGAIYVGTNAHGIYKSIDGSVFTQLSGFPTNYTVLALLQTADGAIYASTNSGIYKSTDGSTFTKLSGFPNGYSAQDLLQTADGAIYVSTSNNGICKSTDGSTFTQLSGFPTDYSVQDLLQTADGAIYASTSYYGIYKSTDGSTFTQLSGFPTNYRAIALLQTADGAIYVGTNAHGIYKSTDGSTFTQLSGFPTNYTVLALLQTADGAIYVGTNAHGIYKSTDGSTFTQFSGFPNGYSAQDLLQTADGAIYASTNAHGIYKSALFMELGKTTYADLYAVVGDRYKAKAGVTDNTKFAIPLVGNDDLTYAVKT